MRDSDKRKLARIRSELRLRLVTQRFEGTQEILLQLREAAASAPENSNELSNEYERWRMRFEVLAT